MLTEWLERWELKTTVVWHADWYSKRHKTAASLIEDSYKSFIQVFHGLSINILLTSCHEVLLGNLNAGLFRDTKHIFNRKNKIYLQKYSAETRYTFPIPLTCGSSQCAPCEILQLLNHCLAQNIEYFIPYLNIWSGMYVKVKWHLISQSGRLRRSRQMVPRICITATVVLWPKMKAPHSTVTAPHTVSATLGKTRTSKTAEVTLEDLVRWWGGWLSSLLPVPNRDLRGPQPPKVTPHCCRGKKTSFTVDQQVQLDRHDNQI